MSIIKLYKANCQNCYKCVRYCPVKAIKVKEHQAQIIDDACILCGTCLKICPQNAKYIRNDIAKVKQFISEGFEVVASLAPSFVSLHDNPKEFIGAVKKLGFSAVEETAAGARLVTKKYKEILKANPEKNIISTSCPTINYLIQRYYPNVVGNMAEVVSPMIAHGKMIKKNRGGNVKVVFIGPCVAKKYESEEVQNEGVVDAALTYDELYQWLEEESIDIAQCDKAEFDNEEPGSSRFYPMPGGILMSMGIDREIQKSMSIDGIDECMDILDYLSSGKSFKGAFLEMNACRGGCLNGSGCNRIRKSIFEERKKLIDFAVESKAKDRNKYDEIKLGKVFIEKLSDNEVPTEEEIKKILRKIGKTDKNKEFNCGACGYNSCREKAIAVYQGKAELYMCLPYMKERAESISNIIISNTPNAIIAINEDFEIQEFNSAAEKLFNLNRVDIIGKKAYDYFDVHEFIDVMELGESFISKKMSFDKYGLVTEATIVHLTEHGITLGILKDITEEEKQKEKDSKLKKESIKLAQDVIDKQMRVAQEIASLLGETTAETKVSLCKLKEIMLDSEEK